MLVSLRESVVMVVTLNASSREQMEGWVKSGDLGFWETWVSFLAFPLTHCVKWMVYGVSLALSILFYRVSISRLI